MMNPLITCLGLNIEIEGKLEEFGDIIKHIRSAWVIYRTISHVHWETKIERQIVDLRQQNVKTAISLY